MADSSPEILEQKGAPVVSSLKVAEHFGKRHRDVLRAIRNLIADCPQDFHERNFALMIHDVEVGKGAVRQEPYYYLTRDGFSLLVMGFTGKEALAWKIRYINAFNAMEQQLQGSLLFNAKTYLLAGALAVLLARETPQRRELVQKALDHAKVGCSGIKSAEILDVSPGTVYRIRRKYAAFTKEFWHYRRLAEQHLPSPERVEEEGRLIGLHHPAAMAEWKRIRLVRGVHHETH